MRPPEQRNGNNVYICVYRTKDDEQGNERRHEGKRVQRKIEGV